MTNKVFLDWGCKLGIAEDALAEIDRISSIPIDDKTVRTDCICSPKSIVDFCETDGMQIDPAKQGFVIVRGCANGDPITVSLRAHEAGSVWYINLERMHGRNLRDISVKAADSVTHFYRSLCDEPGFPYDFYSASKGSGG